MLAVARDGDDPPAAQPVRIAVPGGVWLDAEQTAPLRDLVLRAVGGEDEIFLLDTEAALPSERATALLARCLIGDARDADAETIARSLTVGDREALLLHLRRITLGETLDCVLQCPAEECDERMEIELRVSDLLVPPYDDTRRAYDLTLDADGSHHEICFRIPTATDLDQAGAIARSDPDRGALVLLQRGVLRASRDGEAVSADALSPVVRSEIAAAMGDRDAQAELDLDLTCPTCRRAFSVVFDTATFFLQELDERAARLLSEVHTLAWHYHWSERDILRMPARRRAYYLDLVADAVARAEAP